MATVAIKQNIPISAGPASPPPVERGSIWERVKGAELTKENICAHSSLFLRAAAEIPEEEADSEEAFYLLTAIMTSGLITEEIAFDMIAACGEMEREKLAMSIMATYIEVLDRTPPVKGEIDACKKLDRISVLWLANYSQQCMIYGWKRAKYNEVGDVLAQYAATKNGDFYPFHKVYGWQAGQHDADSGHATTLEGRNFREIVYDMETISKKQKTSRPCKSGLTNLVLENIRRKEEGLSIIPCLFCHEIEGVENDFVAADLGRKGSPNHDAYTSKELRRIWKLCNHENPTIRDVARETFQFLKLKRTGTETYALLPIESPVIGNIILDAYMRIRKIHSTPKADEVNWDTQLTRAIEISDATSEDSTES